MREETAKLVYPVLRYGLRLKEHLRLGPLDMRHEQAELRRLIKAADTASARSGSGEGGDSYLGIGYPLACWLDELFILDPASPWRAAWKEESLEFALARSQDRASKFWEQARQAEVRADGDALEVFYLCMMLGFRGELRDNPGGLREWRERFEASLGKRQRGDWPDKPSELPVPPPTAGQFLRGREGLRWVLLAWALIGSASILLTAFLVIRAVGL